MEENYNLAKWLSNEISSEELKSKEEAVDIDFYEKVKKYSAELKTSDFDEKAMLSNILKSKKEEVKVIPFYNNWLFKVAAVLVIGLGITLFLKNSFNENITVGNGQEMAEITLPDASKVLLNDGSNLNYSKWNWDNNRTLQLSGEAYFKVAKGKKFEVNTTLGKVTVLGTQFNVKDRNNRFDVTCYEGKVKVNYNKEEVIITKGETVSFENNKKIIEQAVSDAEPNWLNNQMAFDKENLKNIIEEIQRQYNINIDLKSQNSVQLFTGKIPSDSIDVALQIIASTYHLEIIKKSNTDFILK